MRYSVRCRLRVSGIALVRGSRPESATARYSAGLLAFPVYHVALTTGSRRRAGEGSVLINTAPLFTALLAVTSLGGGCGSSAGGMR